MKTIRMTAISTEKARSRTQESAPQMLLRTDETGRVSAGLDVGFSGILCYVIIDVFIAGSVACPYFSRELSTGMGTAPSLRARSLKSARLYALPLASLYSSRALTQARQPTKYMGNCAEVSLARCNLAVASSTSWKV